MRTSEPNWLLCSLSPAERNREPRRRSLHLRGAHFSSGAARGRAERRLIRNSATEMRVEPRWCAPGALHGSADGNDQFSFIPNSTDSSARLKCTSASSTSLGRAFGPKTLRIENWKLRAWLASNPASLRIATLPP